jgi:predicted RNA-binding protein YlqC (UPF0109 family)
MRDLVEFLAKSLVDNPDAVQVTSEERSQAVVIELRVSPDDMGKVIGRQGRIAKALRTIIKAASFKAEKPYYVEII